MKKRKLVLTKINNKKKRLTISGESLVKNEKNKRKRKKRNLSQIEKAHKQKKLELNEATRSFVLYLSADQVDSIQSSLLCAESHKRDVSLTSN